MTKQSLNRLISLLLLIAACIVVALIVGQIFFPGNLKPIIAGGVGLSVLALLIPFLSWYLEPKRETTPRKDVINIFVSIASSLILIGSLVLAWLSLDSTQQQTRKNLELSLTALENTRAEQRSRRFTEALEKFGGDTPHKRLAGVYAFRKLDEEYMNEEDWKVFQENALPEDLPNLQKRRRDELKEHGYLMEILTHFIQEVSPSQRDRTNLPDPKIQVEVYEILKYLAGRKLSFGAGETRPLNFSYVDLRDYQLQDFRNLDPNCREEPACEKQPHCRPKFDAARFNNANLAGANLECFSFRQATFADADLTGAILRQTDLSDADFTYARLEGADMTGAVISKDNQLEFASADEKTKCPANFAFDSTLHACLKKP